MRSVTCPDCGAQVEIPVVTVGDESVIVYCKNCLWKDLDQLYGRRGLVVFSGDVAEMACWVCVPPGGGLQGAINALGSGGGNLMLQPGTYTGDITISNSNISIYGSGRDKTILSGSVTITTGNITLHDLWVYANGKSYGIKMYSVPNGSPRNHLNRVRVGGNSDSGGRSPSGDGPQLGLWLDSTILLVADHCLFAFCNTGSGLYVNTTNGTWSTNCNTFRDCTFNGNATKGVEITDGGDGVASMLLHRFHGGNIEDNGTGDFYARGAIGIEIKGIDFESTKNLGSTPTIDLGTCTNVIIEDCHCTTAGNTTRFFLVQSCGNVKVTHCRVSGLQPVGDIGVFDEGSVNCVSYDNTWIASLDTNLYTTSPRWVSNRAQMRGYSA